MRCTRFSAARWLLGGIGLLLATACTDPYLPEAVQNPPNYLVVDGFLNPQGVTTIKLSRTYAIGAKTAPPVEAKATVYLEDDAGVRVLLREALPGTYLSTSMGLNPARRYRLHLNTLAGKEYASDFVPVKITPPIDAVTWQATNTALDVAVNAHDATNATQYYRWETDETWEIRPPYSPTVEYVNKQMRDIVVPYPRICWGNAHSTTVLMYKTTSLSQDVVSNFRVRQIIAPSSLLYSRYSILVQQYALTKEEFAYWELLRKNTESIGSLFDPQPVQLTGNLHCLSKPDELVLGFVSAHSISEQRLFIARAELPGNWQVLNGYEDCMPPDTMLVIPKPRPRVLPNPFDILNSYFAAGQYLPIAPLYNFGTTVGYTFKSKDCIDCRTRGAEVKPSFWP